MAGSGSDEGGTCPADRYQGRNVCGLVPNDEFKEKISLRFAKYILQAEFINNSKGKDLKSLSQETINSTMFFLPDYNEQIKIEEEYEKLEKLKEELNKIKEKISNIINY